jgi:hypothetical protein
MNTDFLGYIQNFMDRIGIPLEAKNEMLKVEKKIFSDENILKVFSKSKIELMNNNISLDETLATISTFSKELDISEYTLHFVFLMNCTDILFLNYKREHIDEQIFWDTMDDFRCKLLECYEVMGVWGTFVAGWYADFLNMKRFALGRFQYEEISFESNTYMKNGIVLNKGDKVYNFHIPSSGKGLDKSVRIASYRKAYDFFGFKEKDGILILVCNSWLLHKELQNILPKTSNILDFIHDFDIVSSTDTENFDDSWRVFGKHHKMPLEQLPIDTSLRKAVVEHLLSEGKMGTGFGIIVFDGNKIINN